MLPAGIRACQTKGIIITQVFETNIRTQLCNLYIAQQSYRAAIICTPATAGQEQAIVQHALGMYLLVSGVTDTWRVHMRGCYHLQGSKASAHLHSGVTVTKNCMKQSRHAHLVDVWLVQHLLKEEACITDAPVLVQNSL